MTLCKIGVIGAGVIGRGVSQSLAQAGYSVTMVDVSIPILQDAKKDIAKGLRLSALTNATIRKANHAEILSRIALSTDLASVADAEYVVENVTENWDVKQNVYRLLDQHCQRSCMFAVNTSAIPIDHLAMITSRPGSVIGIHFMNPVPSKPFVELIIGDRTEEATVKKTREILAQMGKEAIVVRDKPGFVSNRVMMLMINEAISTVADGVACAEDVDKIFVHCFAHKMGPLATADLIGLDTILYTLEVLYQSYNDTKFKACPLLIELVRSGKLGRKTGVGFFNYNTLTAIQ